MSTPESFAADIAPYVTPAYWNGHYLGDNDAQPPPDKPVVKASYETALQLTGLLSRLGHQINCTRLNPGETFDPTEHQPGTVILYREETLGKRPPRASLDDIPPSQDAATMHTGLAHVVGEHTTDIDLHDDTLGYFSQLRWGLVTDYAPDQRLHSTTAKRIVRTANGYRPVLIPRVDKEFYLPMQNTLPLEVGSVRHNISVGTVADAGEALRRVTALEICEIAQKSRSRKHVLDLGGLVRRFVEGT